MNADLIKLTQDIHALASGEGSTIESLMERGFTDGEATAMRNGAYPSWLTAERAGELIEMLEA